MNVTAELAQSDYELVPLDASDVQVTYDSLVLRADVMDVMRESDGQFVEPQNGLAVEHGANALRPACSGLKTRL